MKLFLFTFIYKSILLYPFSYYFMYYLIDIQDLSSHFLEFSWFKFFTPILGGVESCYNALILISIFICDKKIDNIFHLSIKTNYDIGKMKSLSARLD